jgi:hypothetical protein
MRASSTCRGRASGRTSCAARGRRRRLTTLATLTILFAASAPEAEARITRIVLERAESPAFEGAAFGDAGQFEKLVGVAYGEVDPRQPLNAIIQDVELAPRNARGMVEYSTDVYIIKPIDLKRGNRMMVYEFANRGNKTLLNLVQLNVRWRTPNDALTAGDGNLQRMGYTIVWSGWQGDVRRVAGRMTMRVPVATNPDGSPITGVVRQEIIVPAPAYSAAFNISRFTRPDTDTTYATVSLDNRKPFADGFLPTLTVRNNPDDPRVPIPNTAWTFARCGTFSVVPSDRDLCLTNGDRFQPGRIYELIYRARDPLVMGLGYAAVRDLMAFFKYEARDDAGTANPLWLPGDRPKTVTVGTSQSSRNIRSFIHLGFNQDEAGRMVFDGAFAHSAAGRGQINTRFSHGGRAWGQVPDNDYPAYEFPFAYMPMEDPLTGRTDGILRRCLKTNSCPKIFHLATSLEMWEGRQSLGLTDPLGRVDLREPALVRTYIFGSTQHGRVTTMTGSRGGAFGDCAQQTNPNSDLEPTRALWKAFTDWVRVGAVPPSSVVPRVRDGTLVPAPQLRFPAIPANTYEGIIRAAVKVPSLPNTLAVRDYGPLFRGADESGIITVEPPAVVGPRGYTILVPAVDDDGNDVAGRLSIALLAPLGTYTGWNFGRGDRWPERMCALEGSFIPFARTRAERLAVGDPRPSLEERYGNTQGYVAAVRAAARRLVEQRLLLPEDADRLINEALVSEVLR